MADADVLEFLDGGLWWRVIEDTIRPTEESSLVMEEELGVEVSKVTLLERLLSEDVRCMDSWFAIGVYLVGDDVIDWGLENGLVAMTGDFCSSFLLTDFESFAFDEELPTFGSPAFVLANEFPIKEVFAMSLYGMRVWDKLVCRLYRDDFKITHPNHW